METCIPVTGANQYGHSARRRHLQANHINCISSKMCSQLSETITREGHKHNFGIFSEVTGHSESIPKSQAKALLKFLHFRTLCLEVGSFKPHREENEEDWIHTHTNETNFYLKEGFICAG